MTEKQRRFVEHYSDSGNAADAARKAGYSEDSARVQGCENLTKPNIRAAIQERMDKAGITEPRLLKTLDEGLNAHVVKVFHEGGQIVESKPYVDHVTRHKYLETALKLRDAFPSQKIDINVNIFEGKTPEELEYFSDHGEWPEEDKG